MKIQLAKEYVFRAIRERLCHDGNLPDTRIEVIGLGPAGDGFEVVVRQAKPEPKEVATKTGAKIRLASLDGVRI